MLEFYCFRLLISEFQTFDTFDINLSKKNLKIMSSSQNTTPKKARSQSQSEEFSYVEEEQNESQLQEDLSKLNRQQLIQLQKELYQKKIEKEQEKDSLLLEKWKLKEILDK